GPPPASPWRRQRQRQRQRQRRRTYPTTRRPRRRSPPGAGGRHAKAARRNQSGHPDVRGLPQLRVLGPDQRGPPGRAGPGCSSDEVPRAGRGGGGPGAVRGGWCGRGRRRGGGGAEELGGLGAGLEPEVQSGSPLFLCRLGIAEAIAERVVALVRLEKARVLYRRRRDEGL
ncbi:hypothetical protein B0H67DRAFT_608068, partial [Lasiosphaeris hirsuta]